MITADRRTFLAKALMFGSTIAWPWAGSAKTLSEDTSPLPSLNGLKILFTYGGLVDHEPEKFAVHMTQWMRDEGAEVFLRTSLEEYANQEFMKTIDLVIQIFTMSQITDAQQKGLLEAIENNGTGMAGWHGGMCDAFRNNTQYQFMTGGQFVAHPGGVVGYSVDISDQNDAVTKGLKSFEMRSEQYYMHVDPNVKVLATTRFNGKVNSWIDGCVIPVTWKKMFGKGRIFYTSVGHNLDHITSRPDALEMLKRGIRWASASKYAPAEKWVAPVYGR